MREMKIFLLLMILVLAGIFTLAQSAPPRINYQGVLRDSSGTPIDGNVNMTFLFYDDPSGGTMLWEEIYDNGAHPAPVDVSGGLFSVSLGDAVHRGGGSESVFLDVFANRSDVYLAVRVGADSEMTPRIKVVSSAYALNSARLEGRNSSDFAEASHGHQGGEISGAVGEASHAVNADQTVNADTLDGMHAADLTASALGAVVDAADTTLMRSGTGIAGDPFKLAIRLDRSNTWTGTYTWFKDAVFIGTCATTPNIHSNLLLMVGDGNTSDLLLDSGTTGYGEYSQPYFTLGKNHTALTGKQLSFTFDDNGYPWIVDGGYGLRINSIVKSSGAQAGTAITNLYGIKIEPQTAGTNNWGFYSTSKFQNKGPAVFGDAGLDGQIDIYSEQGATDYKLTLSPNAAMTANTQIFFPAARPSGESFLKMGADGVIDFDAQTYISAESDPRLPEPGAAGNILQSTGTGWQSAPPDIMANEDDGVIGNEIKDSADDTLIRSGSGTTGDPYKLAVNLGRNNIWTADQTVTGTVSANRFTNSYSSYDGVNGGTLSGTTWTDNGSPGWGDRQWIGATFKDSDGTTVTVINSSATTLTLMSGEGVDNGAYTLLGTGNEAFGLGSLNRHEGNYQTAVGAYSLNGSKGYANTAVGFYALGGAAGHSNTALGVSSMRFTTTGFFNLAAGVEALSRNTTGKRNTALGGYDAMLQNTDGSDNVAVGYGALAAASSPEGNIVIGSGALATLNNEDSNYNIAIGYTAGDEQSQGSGNILIGKDVNAPSTSGSNQLNIGNAVYGVGMGTASPEIGIGVQVPEAVLHLKAGGPSAFGAPLKFSEGELLISPEAGTVEYSGDAFYATVETAGGPVRRALAFVDSAPPEGAIGGGAGIDRDRQGTEDAGSQGHGSKDAGLPDLRNNRNHICFFSLGKLEEGDVVVLDPLGNGFVNKCVEASDPRVIGIVTVSKCPEEGQIQAERVAVACGGIVFTKADADYGPIQTGDLVATSPSEGYAMKSVSSKTGTILGKALEPLERGKGEIRVLVMLR